MTALELSSNRPILSESSGCCITIDNMKILTQGKYFLIVQIEGNSSLSDAVQGPNLIFWYIL
jgi:hypothetical protein